MFLHLVSFAVSEVTIVDLGRFQEKSCVVSLIVSCLPYKKQINFELIKIVVFGIKHKYIIHIQYNIQYRKSILSKSQGAAEGRMAHNNG